MYVMYFDFRIVYCNNYFFFLILDKRYRDDEYVVILDL